MAIKVLGDKPVDARTLTCGGCGYKLEYRPSDITVIKDPDEPGDNGSFLICPRCKKYNRMSDPSRITDDTY